MYAQRARLAFGAVAAGALAMAFTVPGGSGIAAGLGHTAREAGAGTYVQTNLVSDIPGRAQITDPNLVNAWGASYGPGTPLWVSDNGTNVSTLYTGAVGNPESPVVKNAAIHPTIAGGAPTGQVNNDTTAFVIPGTTTTARFMFITETGVLSAWGGGATSTEVGHTDGAVYKGLALVHGASGPMLLGANFHDGTIDVWDGSFNRVDTTGLFTDPKIPSDFAPFNVAEINGKVFVTYAKQDADREDDVAGKGNGYIDVYSTSGELLQRFARHGLLNSPWGLTIAPANFGQFSGDLLVGNFGDGTIHAFDPDTGEQLGPIRGADNRPIQIFGLWGLLVGDAAAGGPDSVWFSAGPGFESHGLLGILRAG
jgi:uncharacterized protein (TIGR03118 family)